MVNAKQQGTQSLSWFRPRGPYVQQWCARGTILLSTGGACSGAATSKAGEEMWLPSPGVVAEGVVLRCVVYLFFFVSSPAAGGFVLLL
jgi:hypothetical protein